jgi:hypothetical protein
MEYHGFFLKATGVSPFDFNNGPGHRVRTLV